MINKLKSPSEFTRNILTLMSGSILAQAIPIAISPILTRLYSPKDFGILAFFVAITSLFGNIASGKYELAIMLPRKDEDAINILALGFLITCFSVLISLFFIIILNIFFIKNGEIKFWLYFIPISVFFSGLYNLLNYFNNRRKNYKDLRNAVILKSIVLASIQLSFVFIKSGASGLISGSLFSNFVANGKLLKNILKDKILISKISKIKIIAAAKKYKDFPKHSLPSNLANDLALQLPPLIIPKLFTLNLNGYFSFSQRIINLPMTVIASSISQVYYQKLSENKKQNINNFPLLLNTIKKLFIISIPIGIMIFIFAPSIFAIVFGEEWRISGQISRYLVFVFIIRFVASTLSITFAAYQKLNIWAYWQYSYLLALIVFFSFAYFLKINFMLFVACYSVIGFCAYSVYLYLIIFNINYEKEKFENKK